MTKLQSDSLADDFNLFLNDRLFPCVGAKSALARDQISYCMADDIRTAHDDAQITAQLQAYAASCTDESLFVSFIVIFRNTPTLSEAEFEHFLWQRLQAIHDTDIEHYGWDPRVSSDPESPHFSLSVGSKGFYIVGLHPGASRPARQFARPALVFNLHSQFELLRGEGSYTRIREAIVARDTKLSGTQNPMLAEHGQSSEARQYSGRATGNAWQCPFHMRHKE